MLPTANSKNMVIIPDLLPSKPILGIFFGTAIKLSFSRQFGAALRKQYPALLCSALRGLSLKATMRQDWINTNVDKKETLGQRKRLRRYVKGEGRALFLCLREMSWVPVSETMESLSIDYTSDHIERSLGRLQLPIEVIGMIFSEVEDASDAFCLAVTNTRLMIIGESRLRQLFSPPNWRGDRILCIGESARNGDLPEGLLSDNRRIEETHRDTHNQNVDANCAFVPTNLFSEIESLSSDFQFYHFGLTDSMQNVLLRITEKLTCLDTKMWPICWKFYTKLVDVEERVFKDPDVLWNLTKKVYYRREVALKVFEGHPRQRPLDEFNLMGMILHLQICWSTYDDTSMAYSGLHRGKWAGDRFEFTGKEVLDTRSAEDWKDISEDVVDLFVQVFEAEHGETWRDEFDVV